MEARDLDLSRNESLIETLICRKAKSGFCQALSYQLNLHGKTAILHPMAKKAARQVVRYIPSVEKALEVILWLAEKQPGIDVYHVVKSTFYADKFHINKYGRPVIGDHYRAAWWGPLPRVVYGLLRFRPMEILALGGNGKLPFRVEEGTFGVYGDRGPNIKRLSASDVEALQHGWSQVHDKTFDELFQETHNDPAYQNAIDGNMDYRDFISGGSNIKKRIEYLEEVARTAAL